MTSRITINIEDEILELLEEDAKSKRISRAQLAGDLIMNHYNAPTKQGDSLMIEYESKINNLESEVRELKSDKIWYQGELSRLHDGIINRLPAPQPEKKMFRWPWSKSE